MFNYVHKPRYPRCSSALQPHYLFPLPSLSSSSIFFYVNNQNHKKKNPLPKSSSCPYLHLSIVDDNKSKHFVMVLSKKMKIRHWDSYHWQYKICITKPHFFSYHDCEFIQPEYIYIAYCHMQNWKIHFPSKNVLIKLNIWHELCKQHVLLFKKKELHVFVNIWWCLQQGHKGEMLHFHLIVSTAHLWLTVCNKISIFHVYL
jgi:hypothetical protein